MAATFKELIEGIRSRRVVNPAQALANLLGAANWTFTGIVNFAAGSSEHHADNVKTFWGTGDDLSVFHDATESWITNLTGDLNLVAPGTNNIELWGLGGTTRLLSIEDLAAGNVSATFGLAGQATPGVDAVTVRLEESAGVIRRIIWQTGTTARWLMQANATAESGSNAGSDFDINSFADAGGFLRTNLTIIRSSGQFRFLQDSATVLALGASQDLTLGHGGTNSRITNNTGFLEIFQGATEVARFDSSTTATHTRFLVFDVDNNALERVTVGAADSGGTGFKVLRIPN